MLKIIYKTMYYIVDAGIDSELICVQGFEKLLSFIPLIHKLSEIIKIKKKKRLNFYY